MLLVTLLFLLLDYPQFTSQVTYPCNPNAACGCSTSSALVTKIVGGETAAINTWGWAVSLFIDESALCGGSIISSTWIVTAAHCVEGMQASQVLVSAATNELYGGKQLRYASSVIWHPQYDNETAENDIALIEVSPPFNMSDPGIAKICLPMSTKEDFPPTNSTLVAIGWGLLTENGNISQTLQQVTLQRIAYDDYRCHFSIDNDSIQFCAGVNNGGKGPCQGDSGGALMMFTPSQQWILVGIVSYGYGCARADYADVFTRVVYYLDWIHSMNVSNAITVQSSTGIPQTRKISMEHMLVGLLINILLSIYF